MKISEFRALLGCVFPLLAAAARADVDAMHRVEVRVNAVHAQIDARKAAR